MFNVFQFGQRTNFEISCPGKFDLSYETEHYYLLDSSKPDMATELFLRWTIDLTQNWTGWFNAKVKLYLQKTSFSSLIQYAH